MATMVHAHGANTGDGANVAKDPVCGMTVTESSPHQVDHAGQRYYFCSAKCQEKFTAEPDKYVASKSAAPAAVAAPAAPAGTIYTCPMHPEIVREAPPGNCPICGMALEPVMPASTTARTRN